MSKRIDENKSGEKLALCFGRGVVSSQKDFDKYYIDYEVKKVARKTGDGEDDFVIEDKVIVHRRLISEVVNAEADQVGVEAYLRRLALSGESIPDVVTSDEVVDYTKFPQTTAEQMKMQDNALAAFEKLPKELTQGMTYEQFLQSDIQKLLDDYYAKVAAAKTETQAKESEVK